jgi:TPR repeat protein
LKWNSLIARYKLGVCYELGIGADKDEIKAFECYEESAKHRINYMMKLMLGIKIIHKSLLKMMKIT